jgi:CRP/FNR family cyclic AMP-dependent transcriptional regulator
LIAKADMRVRWSPAEIEVLLNRGAWFGELPLSLRRELLGYARVKRFKRGAAIYNQGDPPRGMWAVLDGSVCFSKIGGSGHEVIYYVGGPGMWFGMLGALTGLPLGLTVAAAIDSTMLWIRRADVDRIVQHEPRNVLPLLRASLSRAVDLIDAVEVVTRPSPTSRVAARLLMLWQQRTREDPLAANAPLRVTQSHLAAMTALSRQSVSRVLHEIAAHKAISVGFKEVTVLAPDRLEEIANAAA